MGGQLAAAEVDSGLEVLPVSEAARPAFDDLDLVLALRHAVGDPMPAKGQDICLGASPASPRRCALGPSLTSSPKSATFCETSGQPRYVGFAARTSFLRG